MRTCYLLIQYSSEFLPAGDIYQIEGRGYINKKKPGQNPNPTANRIASISIINPYQSTQTGGLPAATFQPASQENAKVATITAQLHQQTFRILTSTD